jgi:hypothetical protein
MHRTLQFRLRTFFIITALVSAIVGFAIMQFQYRQKLQAHYASFEKLYYDTSEFETKLKLEIASLPEVMELLRSKSEIAPENYLEGGCGSSAALGSPFVGEANFLRDYSYRWSDKNGSYDDRNKIEIRVSSVLNPNSFDQHVVELQYVGTKFNRDVATWMEQQLVKHNDVIVRHVTLQ